jgi:hypothetical protein
MGREVLKWLAALGTGALTALLAYLSANTGTGPDLGDPFLSGIVVGIVTRLVGWLTSKVPAEPTTPPAFRG